VIGLTPIPLRVLLIAVSLGSAAVPAAADALLDQAVDFTGAIAFVGAGAPALVIAAVRDGDTAFAGFGETARGSGVAPTADTLMRVASISKAFCGDVLASLVADGEIGPADPVQAHLPDGFEVPAKDGRTLRIVDLATQITGLPREMAQTGGTPPIPKPVILARR
jgi:serine-type D-Ala-D-Ala carboxypeptidase/endopeptidase